MNNKKNKEKNAGVYDEIHIQVTSFTGKWTNYMYSYLPTNQLDYSCNLSGRLS